LGCVVAAAHLISSPALWGQTVTPRQLEVATRIECRFAERVTGTWEEGIPATTVESTEFELAFFDIDVETGTAEAEGRFGASFIAMRYANGYLHFMQMFNDGPLYVTTIMARETTEGRVMALHSRHEYSPSIAVGFTRLPEMYIGDCALGNR
jgi:hypothetical protein